MYPTSQKTFYNNQHFRFQGNLVTSASQHPNPPSCYSGRVNQVRGCSKIDTRRRFAETYKVRMRNRQIFIKKEKFIDLTCQTFQKRAQIQKISRGKLGRSGCDCGAYAKTAREPTYCPTVLPPQGGGSPDPFCPTCPLCLLKASLTKVKLASDVYQGPTW